MARRNDQIAEPLRPGGDTPTLSTLIEQQMKVVSHLQGYAGYGDNGSQETREYGLALSAAIDKLATLEGLRDDGAVWRLRQKPENATS